MLRLYNDLNILEKVRNPESGVLYLKLATCSRNYVGEDQDAFPESNNVVGEEKSTNIRAREVRKPGVSSKLGTRLWLVSDPFDA